MKKIVCFLLVVNLFLLSSCGNKFVFNQGNSTSSENDDTNIESEVNATLDRIIFPIEDTWDASATGFTFTKNDRLKNAKGQVFKYDIGEIEPGIGVLMFAAAYCAIDKKEYNEIRSKILKIIENNGSENTLDDIINDFYSHFTALFSVYGINTGNTIEDLKSKLSSVMASSEDVNELFDTSITSYIGSIDGWNYFYIYTKPENITEDVLIKLDEYKDDYMNLLTHADEYKDLIKLKKPVIYDMGTASDKVSFKAKDLDGKDWTSEELFKNNKLTLVNVWGTNCPPCVVEMPELEKLNGKLKEKGCGVIGIITDGELKPEDAKDLIKTTGVTYPNVCFNEEIYNLLPIQVTPTTFFIDRDGNVIGDPIYGAKNAESYEAEFEKHLALINK